MGLAPAPLNLWLLAWVALVPLWVLVLGGDSPIPTNRNRLCGRSLLLALAWGIGYHGLSLSWITGLHPLTWMGIPWLGSIAIALFCWLFITLWGAALVIVWTWAMQALHAGVSYRPATGGSHSPTPYLPSAWIRVLIGTALWCILEWIWSLGSLYWTSLSYTQSPGNLMILHLGRLSGPAMVTAAIVVVNGLLAEVWIRYQQRRVQHSTEQLPAIDHPYTLLTLAVVLLISLHLAGYELYKQPLMQSEEGSLKVGVVQGNVPTRIKLSPEGVRRAIEGYVNGYATLADQGADAVLTPEGALPILWNDRDKDRNPFYQAVLKKGRAAWLGTFVRRDSKITQSLLSLTGKGEVVGQYNKIKLVPLGEYIPFQEILGGLIDRLSPMSYDMLPGTAAQRFDTPFGRAIASICYESAFPELFRAQAAAGGQFILTASNLDPYSEVLMAQHQAQDLMRAIETDRWAARVTNTGYSGIINPHGRIVWRSRPNVYELHTDTIYRRQTRTPYVRFGDWLTPLLAILAAIAGIVHRLRWFGRKISD